MSLNIVRQTVPLESGGRVWSGKLCNVRGWRGLIVRADFEQGTQTFRRVGFWHWWALRLRGLFLVLRGEWRSVVRAPSGSPSVSGTDEPHA